jgi:hypothetical protein
MSGALNFNPWKIENSEGPAPNPPNPPKLGERVAASLAGLGALGADAEQKPTISEASLGALGALGSGDAPFVNDQEERDAIVAEAAMPAPPEPPPLAIDDPLVTRLAVALMAPRPWQKITDPEKALLYFQGEALRRLQRLNPLARGLLVSAEEAEARRWEAKL